MSAPEEKAAAEPAPQGTGAADPTPPKATGDATPAPAPPAPAPAAEDPDTAKRRCEEDEKERDRKEVAACEAPADDAGAFLRHPTVQGVQAAKGATSGSFVGATCLWLVCDNINRAIASLERVGVINTLQEWVDKTPEVLQDLQASHTAYEAYAVSELLEGDTAKNFVRLHASGVQRKYGNAGTSKDDRVKCLHAHTATYLSRIPNPVGYVVFHSLSRMASLASSDDVSPAVAEVVGEYAGLSKEAVQRPVTHQQIGALCSHVASLVGLPTDGQQGRKRRRKKRLN